MKKLLLLLAGSLVLQIPALINDYPMIYSDTSTYLASGFVLQPPMDRPLTYGLFIRLFSLNGISLWPVIFMQSFILVYLIYQMLSLVFEGDQKRQIFTFLSVIIIAAFSGAGWAACYLIPDIFAPIWLISAILILLPGASKGKKIIYFVIYGFATAMHSSHIPMGIALLVTLLVLRLFLRKDARSLIRVRPLLIMMGITLASILAMGSSLSKSKHVFLMGAFIEQGIIKTYLDEHCATRDYKLCTYKDSLPEHAWEFIWQESSPLYKMGGWKETREEYNDIIRATFTSPKFLFLHGLASLKATAMQLVKFEGLDYRGVAPNASVLHSRVESYVPRDLGRFENSKQNLGQLDQFKWFNPLQLILVLMSLLTLGFFFSFSQNLRRRQVLVMVGLILVLGILLNAWVCGTFANPIDRLGNRMIWLIPAYAILIISLATRMPIKKQPDSY